MRGLTTYPKKRLMFQTLFNAFLTGDLCVELRRYKARVVNVVSGSGSHQSKDGIWHGRLAVTTFPLSSLRYDITQHAHP